MTPLNLQPIPYQGSKRSLAPRISKLFPQKIRTLYEPFAGSAAVSIYAAHNELAERFIIGDIFPELIALWELIINRPEEICDQYRRIWSEQFDAGLPHFNMVRTNFNQSREPAALLYLIARCVKNAVRFNKKGDFTQSVDKRRTGMKPDKMEATVRRVSSLLKKKTELYVGDFSGCIKTATSRDLVYMDPPYQGTTYGSDKRYAAGVEREKLIYVLENLNHRSVPFILSYDGKTGDKQYGDPLPASLGSTHLYINAGRSSQATLAGRAETTMESLYLSANVAARLKKIPDYSSQSSPQTELFAK
jgi:DNA adenine methylase